MSALPVGYAHGIDGPVEVTRWCPECQDLVIARDDKRCSWCDTPTTPAAGERGAPMAIATETRPCKIEGCEEDANTRYDRGPFARLCATHIEERRVELSTVNSRPGGGQRV